MTAVLTMVVLNGCTTSNPAPRMPTATPTLDSTMTVRAATGLPLPTLLPTPTGVTCGTIMIHDDRLINPDVADTAQNCFVRAYQRCAVDQKMAVVRTYLGGNSTVELYVPVDRGGRCMIEISGFAAPVTDAGVKGPGAVSMMMQCAGLVRDSDGILLFTGCSNGTSQKLFTIPA